MQIATIYCKHNPICILSIGDDKDVSLMKTIMGELQHNDKSTIEKLIKDISPNNECTKKCFLVGIFDSIFIFIPQYDIPEVDFKNMMQYFTTDESHWEQVLNAPIWEDFIPSIDIPEEESNLLDMSLYDMMQHIMAEILTDEENANTFHIYQINHLSDAYHFPGLKGSLIKQNDNYYIKTEINLIEFFPEKELCGAVEVLCQIEDLEK